MGKSEGSKGEHTGQEKIQMFKIALDKVTFFDAAVIF